MEHEGLEIAAFDVKHVPIITAFAHKIGLVEEIDSRIKGEMEISPGRVVLAMILDSLFLKTAQRIEALGMDLILAQLLWRLVHELLRESIQETGIPVEGWKGKPTEKPTSFMMTTKFSSVTVIVINGIRHIGRPLTDAQKGYLARLNLSPDIFTTFPGKPPPPLRKKIQRE